MAVAGFLLLFVTVVLEDRDTNEQIGSLRLHRRSSREWRRLRRLMWCGLLFGFHGSRSEQESKRAITLRMMALEKLNLGMCQRSIIRSWASARRGRRRQ